MPRERTQAQWLAAWEWGRDAPRSELRSLREYGWGSAKSLAAHLDESEAIVLHRERGLREPKGESGVRYYEALYAVKQRRDRQREQIEAEREERLRARLEREGRCPTCDQPIPTAAVTVGQALDQRAPSREGP